TPRFVGWVVNVTVNCVALAAVTVPAAPSSKVTLSLAGVAEKPIPLITTVGAFLARLAVFGVIENATTVATCTAAPLPTPLDVTTAVRLPTDGWVLNVTVNWVALAAVTVPTAPRLKLTLLLAGVLEKPNPLMVSVVALVARLAVLMVTTGLTVATCTGAPLLK